MFAVGSTKAGFCPPSSRRIGVRFFAAASMTILPTLTLPVKKMKSNGSLRSSVTSSLLPVTAVTARGSKYFGMRSRKNLARRVEKQGQWPIERTNHQGDTVRFSIDLGSMSALPKGFRHDDIYRLHPLFQFLLREGGGSNRRHNLEDFFLAGRLEVAAHRSLQNLGVLIAQVLKACQLIDAPLVRFGRVRIEARLLFVKDFLE